MNGYYCTPKLSWLEESLNQLRTDQRFPEIQPTVYVLEIPYWPNPTPDMSNERNGPEISDVIIIDMNDI